MPYPLTSSPSARVRAYSPLRWMWHVAFPSLWVASLVLAHASPARAIGLLVPQDGSQALVLVHHHVQVRVQERGATTKVEQVFSNPNPSPLEAVYFFPLPIDATVNEFALWMNGKRHVGKVLPKDEARRIYGSIVRATRDPGLIEYVDAQLFQARVFPIPPHGEQRVELTYSHLVPYDNGVHRYVYPMKTDQQAAKTLRDFVFSIEVEGKMPVQNLYSPTHRIVAQVSGSRARASFEKERFTLQDDFRLYWAIDDRALGMTLLTHQEGDEAGYFLLMASPQDEVRHKEIVGRRITFVVDTSGSMSGEKMTAVKNALSYGILQLGEDDLFQVVAFGGHVERFAERMVAASEQNKREALNFIKHLEPLGGTPIEEALRLALSSATGSKSIPHQVIFVTDGRPTIGETDPIKIRERVVDEASAETRIFSLGVGDDVNPSLLDALAEENHGKSAYIRGNATAEQELRTFFDRIRYPVLVDVKWQIQARRPTNAEEIRILHSHPSRLDDLFYGEQLLVVGRYRGAGEVDIELTGTTTLGPRTFRYPAALQPGNLGHDFLPRLWAQREVARMLREIRDRGEKPDTVQELKQLAMKFGIVTPYTSYLVVEAHEHSGSDEKRDFGFVPRPQPLPHVAGFRGRAHRATGSAAPPPSSKMQRNVQLPEAEGWHARLGRSSLREESGADAVRMAKEIQSLQEGVLREKSAATQRTAFVLGRVFRQVDGVYVDSHCQEADVLLRIRSYSDAYFEVLRLRPDLKPALRLSERVRVQVSPGRTLFIEADAPEETSLAELRGFLAPI